VVIIDEIDAHLHPAAQRRVIPALQRHFPRLQIFCSTHSPLMLAGLKMSQVQLFRRDERGKVTVSRNETDIVGWSVDEILQGFLGVEHPAEAGLRFQLDRLQELRRLETPSMTEPAGLAALPHATSQTLPDETLSGLLSRRQRRPSHCRGGQSQNVASTPKTQRREGRDDTDHTPALQVKIKSWTHPEARAGELRPGYGLQDRGHTAGLVEVLAATLTLRSQTYHAHAHRL
jgi:hypothetical protein